LPFSSQSRPTKQYQMCNTDQFFCLLWGSHSGDYEDCGLLRHTAVQFGRSPPTFRRQVSPPSSGSKSKPNKKAAVLPAACFSLAWYILYPENGADTFLRRAGLSGSHTALQSVKLKSDSQSSLTNLCVDNRYRTKLIKLSQVQNTLPWEFTCGPDRVFHFTHEFIFCCVCKQTDIYLGR
jgi:hypothetical protein